MKTICIARQPNLFQQYAFPHFTVSEDYQIIDKVLEDEQIVFELAKDIPDAHTGRNRTPAEQTLRFLVLKHQKGLSLRDLERTLKENLSDRWFCKVNENPPCFKTIQNQLFLISEDTIKRINERIMREACARKMTKGKKFRVDSTITEAHIHYPTDSSLIADAIRKVTTVVRHNSLLIPKGFRSFTCLIKKQRNLIRTIGRRNKDVRAQAIQKIVEMGRHISHHTSTVKDITVHYWRNLLDKIIAQTEQVQKGVMPKNRIVSIFEPSARPFRKGKAGIIAEFGQEVQIQEDEHFITNWELNQRPSDTAFLTKAIQAHIRIHGKPPREAATDRGYWSPENYQYAKDNNIKHISMPKKGGLNEQEKQRQSTRSFIRGQRFRAGGEAKISLLKRIYGLTRSLYKGEQGMKRWVGAGILACNLANFVRLAHA